MQCLNSRVSMLFTIPLLFAVLTPAGAAATAGGLLSGGSTRCRRGW